MNGKFLGLCSLFLAIGCGTTSSPATNGGSDASGDTGPIGVTDTGIAAPSQFTCTSASKGAAGFSWQKSPTAGVVSYVVERAPLDGDFVALPAVDATATTFADLTVAQFETYRYRVRAKTADKLGDSSNQVSVGAMPPGFHAATTSPVGAEATSGTHIDLTLDGNGDPALIYYDGSALQFLGWDRKNARWKAPVEVTKSIALLATGATAATISFDKGGSAGTFAVIWAMGDGSEIDWALSSDGGKTWQKDTFAVAPVKTLLTQPTLVLGNGKAHVTWVQDGQHVFYQSGTLSTPAKNWSAKQEAPFAAKCDTVLSFAPVIALDPGAQPALGYFSHGLDGSTIATYWRPGDKNPTIILSSQAYDDPHPSLSLAFKGQEPRAAVTLHHSANTIEPVWFVTSSNGSSWGEALALPPDGNSSGGLFTRLVTTSKGASAVVYASSNPGGGKCGEPKLVTSEDGKTWTACSPDEDAIRAKVTEFARIVLQADGKKVMAWQEPAKGGGVVIWREE
jgi:hypothetical protein